jgi:uncharacterized phosphosugar-binding protein
MGHPTNMKSQRGHHGQDAEGHLIRKVGVMTIAVTAGEVKADDVIAVNSGLGNNPAGIIATASAGRGKRYHKL